MTASLLAALLLASPALALRPLTAEQKSRCEAAARSGFTEWKRADLSKLPAPSPDKAAYPLELPLNVVVYNHKGFWSMDSGEDEIGYHLERAQETYRQCGVEPVIDSLRYVEGPDFLDDVDRGADNGSRLTERERCLFGPLKRDGMVNVIFVGSVDSDRGASTSHALTRRGFAGGEYSLEEDKSFAGIAVIADGSRAFGGDARKRRLVFAHEIGHIALDSGEVSYGGNLMSDELGRTALSVTPAQCATLKKGPFVRPRR